MAISGGSGKAELYAAVCATDDMDIEATLGWWNEGEAAGAPSVPPSGSEILFSADNSAFYNGGRFNLICGDFSHEAEQNSIVPLIAAPEENPAPIAVSEEAISQEVLASSTSQQEIATEIYDSGANATGTEASVDGNTEEITPENIIEETQVVVEENIDEQDIAESPIEQAVEIIELPEEAPATEVMTDEASLVTRLLAPVKKIIAGYANVLKTSAAVNDGPATKGEFEKAQVRLSLAMHKKTGSQSDLESDSPMLAIWYSLDDGETATTSGLWQELAIVTAKDMSNETNGGYLAYDLPDVKSWSDLAKARIRIEGRSEGSIDHLAYVDSVFIEAAYGNKNEADEEPTEEDRLAWAGMLEFVSEKNDFKVDEQPDFRFKYNKKFRSIANLLGVGSYWTNVNLRAQLVDSAGKTMDYPLAMLFEDDGYFRLRTLDRLRGFKPGKYSVRFFIEDGSGIGSESMELSHDFSWGVLAINASKSIYLPGESAYLQMAVLDGFGRTLCDADLALEITAPDGSAATFSTGDSSITKNPACAPDNVIDSPDYSVMYQTSGIGTYQISLTASTANGTTTIADSFEVRDAVPFDIERTGPTRVYPLADYEMKINIKANEDYSGDIIDIVPAGFKIVDAVCSMQYAGDDSGSLHSTYHILNTDNGEQQIIFSDVDLKPGDVAELKYTVDFPDVSPEFYLVGPLSVGIFSEIRQWQIASDALAVYDANNGTSAGTWTNPTYAWDAVDNFYASRNVVSGVDETGTYIQSTANTAADIGGNISKVEIGIEGYAAKTFVNARLRPVYNGSTVGTTTYTVLGTDMGTLDSNATFYVDITNDNDAPSTWTWNDIINLDVRVHGQNTGASARVLYIDQIRYRVTYNSAPTSTIASATARNDGTGVVDISVRVSDADGDNSRGKLEFATGTTCVFSSPGDPTLDETDANATSTFGDAKIDNASAYQVGTTTGWIQTSSGENTVSFDWLSGTDLLNVEGQYCLRFTANDQMQDQAAQATTTLIVDNRAPSTPGQLTATGTRATSTYLLFGATSTESYFSEYKIFYKEYDGTPVTELDTLISSSSEPDLGSINFNGATSTLVTLIAGTPYSFNIWAYDSNGNKSSSTQIDFTTNNPPTGIFNPSEPAVQTTDGTGVVDISFIADDDDNENTLRARLDYVAGASCDFSSPLDPTLDETQANIYTSYGETHIDNNGVYQIGTEGYWITVSPGSSTVEFDWLSDTDLPEASGDYCLRLTVSDGKDDQLVIATTTVAVDNKAPTVPGALTEAGITTDSITLAFHATSTEDNFSQYKIFYKIGTSGVTEADTPWLDADLSDINFNGSTSTTVNGLDPSTDYVFNIWAYDLNGNKSVSAEVTVKTNATITNDALVFTDPQSGNIAVANGVNEWTFRATVSEEGGWNVLASTTLRLADSADNTPSFDDLVFKWEESTGLFSEIGADALNAASISSNSTSTCAVNTCTLDFKIIFNHRFATSSTEYDAQLISSNDSAIADNDVYDNLYQVKKIKVVQTHYRWRNDNGGE